MKSHTNSYEESKNIDITVEDILLKPFYKG